MPGILASNGFYDDQVERAFADTRDIINSLTKENIKAIVMDLGADRCEEHLTHFVFPTICHNTDATDASMKLYYYFDRKLFICYTECNDGFNILGLVVKVKRLTENNNYSYANAREYVLNFLDGKIERHQQNYEPLENKYKRRMGIVKLPEYNSNILKTFLAAPHSSWIQDGISKEIMQQFDIRYSLDKNAIIIPYLDIDGRLIGIRIRNLNYEANKDAPKYCPLITREITYSHPLGLSLYGVYQNKEAIKRKKEAIIFQGEKSVLLHKGYYKEDSCAVAVCGSNISKTQIDILIKQLGVRHITIALDKEYQDYNSDKADRYFKKLYDMCSKYSNYAKFDFIFDSGNLLKEKDSPIDNGKEIWQQLYQQRVEVKG